MRIASRTNQPLFLAIVLVAVLVASGIAPRDRITWLMETAPVMIILPVLAATYRGFPLTRFLYTLIFLHALVLIVGGIYTYARVPAGFWVQHVFGLHRNPYDKLGHWMQGFVPALAAREIFIRRHIVRGRGMQAALAVCVAMFVSATYELIEWLLALAMGQGAADFLGTQGDEWDTQSDMACALAGSSIAVVFFASWHDRAITELRASRAG